MRFVVDIDGTICSQAEDYREALPDYRIIDKVNELYDEGHEIIFFTARGTKTGIDWRKVTEKQFKKWGVKYHELIFGKPYADVYIDDRMISVEDFGGIYDNR